MQYLLLLVCITACQNNRLEIEFLTEKTDIQTVEAPIPIIQEVRDHEEQTEMKQIVTFPEKKQNESLGENSKERFPPLMSIRNSLSNLFLARLRENVRFFSNITGSTVSITNGSPVTAGLSSTVGFQLNTVSPDDEYIVEIILSAPSGWALTRNSEDAQSSSGRTHTLSVSGSGTNSIIYTITATSGASNPGVRNGETWGIDVDVLAPNGASGANNIAYTINGDNFGAAPHTINGNTSLNVDPGLDPNVICVNVFRDYDSDGMDDGDGEPAISSVTVTAYDDSNNASILSNNNDGTYTFTPGSMDDYRIEVTGLTGNLEPSVAGSTTTFFMSSGSKVEVGLHEPAEYYADSGIFLATPCYVDGASNGANANRDVLVIVPESSLTAGAGNLNATEYFVADHNQIGATFGVAYSRAANSIFAAAFTKRHTAFGPGGTGAIYKIDLNGDEPTTPITSTSATNFVDLNALFGANTAGENPHPDTGTDFNRDSIAYDAVGKVGLGGLAMSESENILWTINLADRKLYEIPLEGTLENPVAPTTSTNISTWPASGDLTTLSGLTGTASDIRPFALKCYRGELYIGMVNTAESTVVYDVETNVISNTGDRSQMRGYIYKFNPDTDTFTKLLEFPLNYARGQAIDFCNNNAQAEFLPWVSIYDSDVMLNATMSTTGGTISERAYPQPWIVDIEFDEEGKMLIGMRDRFADQHGYNKLPPSTLDSDPNTSFTADAAGDILVATINTTDNTTYVLENNSSSGTNGAAFGSTKGANKGEGPGGGEFFFDDRYRPSGAPSDGSRSGCSDANDQDPLLDPQFEQGHDEISTGGIFHYNGNQSVYFTAYDPINNYDNFNNAGMVSLSTADGSRQGANQVYATPTNPGTFAKGNGLGDVEGVFGKAPLQIGNRLWLDSDGNGRQDPSEDGINGVLIELYKETAPFIFTKVAETITAADVVQGNGFFIFSDDSDINQTWVSGTEVLAEMNYEIRVSLANIQAQNTMVQAFSPINTGGATNNDNKTDLNDSDASDTGVITFTTGRAGENNHSLDIGVVDTDFELPVELLNFKAKADEDHIDLIWSTASEFDNSHFELERGEDSKNFKKIAWIDGQGTTLEITDYKYEDKEAIHGVLYYYRLKQVDFDGKFTYSDIRNARLSKAIKDWMIYPNPISQAEMLQINFFTEVMNNRFDIVNVHSRVVLSVERELSPEEWHTIQIDISNLPSGTYILIDRQGNTQRFAKVNQ